jgi:predicted metalloprotease with PDZ domain
MSRFFSTGGKVLAGAVLAAIGHGWAPSAHAQAAATKAGKDAGAIEVEIGAGPVAGTQPLHEISVRVVEPLAEVKAGAPLLRMPLVISNVQTSAASLTDLRARDARGPLALGFHDDASGPEPYRHWVASRAVHGPVELSYRLPISNAPNARGAAPPFELRSDGGAFSGLLGTFLMQPDDTAAYRMKLAWKLAPLGGEALGVSTLGVGNAVTLTAQATKELESVFVMAGDVGHEPARPSADGFFSAWQGTPPFDARALMQWTHRLYGYYLKFFKARNAAYSVYLRSNPINAGGGVEVGSSFVGTFDDKTRIEDFRITLAHEMVHTFVHSLDGPDHLATEWFGEGVAVYYQRVLPLRAGQISPGDYLKDLNSTAARYYTDILNDTPNARIPSRFWADTRVRVLPYDRGSLYFARLNDEIVQASSGRRSLDDVLLGFLERRKQGKPLTEEAWVQAVVAAVGERGRQEFEAMMRGDRIQLRSGAFGPCFRRIEKPMRRYELGFTSDVLIEPRRIVRGLVPGSAAARAGLRNGDEILVPVPQDGIQSDQQARLTLRISRAGKTMDISYLPRGEAVEVPQWVASSSAACKALR